MTLNWYLILIEVSPWQLSFFHVHSQVKRSPYLIRQKSTWLHLEEPSIWPYSPGLYADSTRCPLQKIHSRTDTDSSFVRFFVINSYFNNFIEDYANSHFHLLFLILCVLCFSSLDFEECAHKLIKMDFPESQTVSPQTQFSSNLSFYILDCLVPNVIYSNVNTFKISFRWAELKPSRKRKKANSISKEINKGQHRNTRW